MTGFVLDRPTLERLFEAYEALRARDGMGAMLHHVTPRQRVDAAHVCAAVYAAGLAPSGDQRGFWLRYLRPVLAETREQGAALERALDEISAVQIDPPPPSWRARLKARGTKAATTARTKAGRLADRRVGAFAAALVAAVAIAWIVWPSATGERGDGPFVQARADLPRASPAAGPAGEGGRKASTYQAALLLTFEIVDQHGGAVTPSALAAGYSGALPGLGEPATVLARMLRKVPAPPYAPLPRDAAGAMALRAYAAQIASVRLGEATASFEPFLFDDAAFAGGAADRLRDYAAVGDQPTAPPAAPWERWPWWTVLLPFLVLPAAAVWAFSGRESLRREAVAARLSEAASARREARRTRAGERGSSYVLQAALGASPGLPAASRAVRALMRLREPTSGRRLDVGRSLRATLGSGGDLVTVMRPASRAVDFVFLVRRDCRHDHERARVLRLLNALTDAGVSLTAYDYAQDPRRLTATARVAAGAAETPRAFDLRGLRELHADAVLAIVTDGDDLIDGVAQRPFPVVCDELRLWPRRMLLTPTPVAEWGEREMLLAFALDAPIGRASLAGLADLGLGLAPDAPEGRPRRALRAALVETGFFARIARWTTSAAAMIAPDATPARPRALAAAYPLDVAPPVEARTELLEALKAWLGPAFFWFAACGVYPQIRFDLTLWLGKRLKRYGHPANAELFGEAALERLCLLPWFRRGFVPDWLRVAAFDALSARERAMAREAVAELLAGEVKAADRAAATSGLEVWQADWSGRRLAADEVMLELADPQAEAAVDREAVAEAARAEADRRWRNHGLARLGLFLGWASVAVWLWPDPAAAPHPQGAWLPLIAYAASSALLSLSVLAPVTRGFWERIPDMVLKAEFYLWAKRRPARERPAEAA